jgi:hypothetical protein
LFEFVTNLGDPALQNPLRREPSVVLALVMVLACLSGSIVTAVLALRCSHRSIYRFLLGLTILSFGLSAWVMLVLEVITADLHLSLLLALVASFAAWITTLVAVPRYK